MKVFISWSGATSQRVAVTLRDWLPSVIQAVEPFVSSEDIERGARWFSDIGEELEKIQFGILCITPQNMDAPWILFEAGALSKSVDQSRVSPLLIGVKNSDLKGPLSQFNTTSINSDEIYKLVKTINKQLGDSALAEQKIERAFSKWWPDLEILLEDAAKEANEENSGRETLPRPQSDLLEEILELTRGISRQVTRKSANLDKDQLLKYLWLLKSLGNPSNSKTLRGYFNDLKGEESENQELIKNLMPIFCEYHKANTDKDDEPSEK